VTNLVVATLASAAVFFGCLGAWPARRARRPALPNGPARLAPPRMRGRLRWEHRLAR